MEEEEDPRKVRRIQVKPPANPDTKKVIDKLAIYVSEDGHLFEEELLRRETEGNPLLGFLRHKNSDEAQYYRWKVFTLLAPSSSQSDVRILKGGAVWEATADTPMK